LRFIPARFRAQDNLPLLSDLDSGKTVYVAEQYDLELDIPALRYLGMLDLAVSPGFLARLTQDLGPNSDSSWRTISFTDDWFTRVASLLLDRGNPDLRTALQKLDIVPLQNGSWVKACNASIYWSKSGGITIPDSLHLVVVKDTVLQDTALYKLLEWFGIEEFQPQDILPRIQQRYTGGHSPLTGLPHTQYIAFLFWHHNLIPETDYRVYLPCINDEIHYSYDSTTSGGWIYHLAPNDPLALATILDGRIPVDLRPDVRYLHPAIPAALKNYGVRHGKSGMAWLQDTLRVKTKPQLRQRSGRQKPHKEISAEVKYIAEYMPQYLLGVLKAGWTKYEACDEWDNYFREIQVPVLGGESEIALNTTYLPLPRLTKKVTQLGLETFCSFLEELDDMTDRDYAQWDFLARFGVGTTDTLQFWLDLFDCARTATHIEANGVFAIYARLQTFIDAADVEAIRFVPDETWILQSRY
jgi:hypothetical protein